MNYFWDGAIPPDLKLTEWGDFNIVQRVTAPNGICSDSKMLTIHIEPLPPLANFEDVLPACSPYAVEFINTSKYAKAYQWNFTTSGQF